MERVLLWHLQEEYLSRNPLSANQHAFRSEHSTETALTNLVGRIENAINNGDCALGVFLDIQGAFDNVKPETIVEGLRNKQVDEKLITWYEYYLRNRSMTVTHKGVSVTRYLKRGTPQGGVLSPVMWNLGFESLLSLFENDYAWINGFADDAGLILTGSNTKLMMHRMQAAVDKALDWGTKSGLQFSPHKTVVVLFSRQHKVTYPDRLIMRGREIPFSDTVKYLGLTLDSKLSWKGHLKQKIRNAKGALLKIQNAMGKIWGVPPRYMLWMYESVVRPALSYGALLWAKATSTQWAQNQLTRVNRLALMSITALRRSTPTAGLEILLYVSPLHLHIRQEAFRGYVRTKKRVRIPYVIPKKKAGLLDHRSFAAKEYKTLSSLSESDRIPEQRMWNQQFQVEIDEEGKPLPHIADVAIYTDGSGMAQQVDQPMKIGSGMVIYHGEPNPEREVLAKSYHLAENNTVYQGEVYALKKAAEWINNHCEWESIDIYSDSQASLQALRSTTVISKLVRETKQILNQAGQQNRITLRWVRAHVGHEGNERADELAREGAVLEEGQVEDCPDLPEAHVKQCIREQTRALWQAEWDARKDCRQTKQWFPYIDKKRSFDMRRATRKQLSWMIQLITGHNFMKRHEALVQEGGDSECRLCMEDDESSYHVVAECPALAVQRQMIFGKTFLAQPLLWSIKRLTSFVLEASIGSLLDPDTILSIGEE